MLDETFGRFYVDVCKISLVDHGFSILSMAPSDGQPLNLPSWCPDFGNASFVNGIAGNVAGNDFSAGIAEKTEARRGLKGVDCTFEFDKVEFRGLRMDKITHLVELVHVATLDGSQHATVNAAARLLQCESRCLDLSKAMYKTTDEIPTQHILTLITGMHPDTSMYEAAQATEDYHHMRASYQYSITHGVDLADEEGGYQRKDTSTE